MSHYYLNQDDLTLKLSKTNLYIKSLPLECDDNYLRKLCQPYGKIVSTKAILDPCSGNKCKGYGFVDFESEECAAVAVRELNKKKIFPAQMAKQQEQDPTNLYFSGLPLEINESNLEEILLTFGKVLSTRILRDINQQSKGIGFARMENGLVCERVIDHFNKNRFQDCIQKIEERENSKLTFALKNFSKIDDVIVCKLADGGPVKRRSRDSGKIKNTCNNFSGTNFSGTQLRINISGQNFNANNNINTNSNNINIVNNNGVFPPSNNIIIDHSGTMNHLMQRNLNMSTEPTYNCNSVNLANAISSATPILNGNVALAVLQQQEKQRLLSRQLLQQAALVQSLQNTNRLQNQISPVDFQKQNGLIFQRGWPNISNINNLAMNTGNSPSPYLSNVFANQINIDNPNFDLDLKQR